MNNRELLQGIKDEVEELQGYADAGGDKEMAFDLWAHSGDLQKVLDTLFDFGTSIRTELGS